MAVRRQCANQCLHRPFNVTCARGRVFLPLVLPSCKGSLINISTSPTPHPTLHEHSNPGGGVVYFISKCGEAAMNVQPHSSVSSLGLGSAKASTVSPLLHGATVSSYSRRLSVDLSLPHSCCVFLSMVGNLLVLGFRQHVHLALTKY